MRVTKNNISRAILDETGFNVKISTGIGYFWFYSDDEKTDLLLSGLESTSVYSNLLSHMSVERWVETFYDIINERRP